MRFVHISDTHFGAFNQYEKINSKILEEFLKILELDIDFIIISGDIFNTPFQIFDGLKELIAGIKKFVENGKKIYVIPGSHDKSTNTSLFDILEASGLLINVSKFEQSNGKIKLIPTIDEKTGVHIYGLAGEPNSREINYFSRIDVNPEKDSIFVFHSPIEGTIPFENTQSVNINDMPKGFSYYAGGHIHKRMVFRIDESYLVYPGAFFASTMDELYKENERGYVLVENFIPKFLNLQSINISKIEVDCNGKSFQDILNFLINNVDHTNSDIIFFNLKGKPSFNIDDLNISKIPLKYRKKAIILLRKKEIESEEEQLISEYESMDEELKTIENPFSLDIVKFSNSLKIAKEEGERNEDFKNRLLELLKEEIEKVENYDNKINRP